MRTINEMWEGYKKACYPDGASLTQLKETKQAFFTGAYIFYYIMMEDITPLDEDRAEKELDTLSKEVIQECKRHVTANFYKGN